MYSKTTNFATDKGEFINRNSNQKTTGKLTPWMPAGKIILKTTFVNSFARMTFCY